MYDSATSNANNISLIDLKDSRDVAGRCFAHLVTGGVGDPIWFYRLSPSTTLAAATATLGEASMLMHSLLGKYQIPGSELSEGGQPKDPKTGVWHPLSDLWDGLIRLEYALRLVQQGK